MSSEILFISDLHLTLERPLIIKLFTQFVNERAVHADALYILGDFFEYWIGDDDPAEGLESIFAAFESLKKHNVAVYFMHGNRDFLIGADFAKKTHCQIITEPFTISINNHKIVLLHGDSLCTKDTQYQEFKKRVRAEKWQQAFLAKTLSERKVIVEGLRQTSQTETSIKDEKIMDAEETAINELFHNEQVRYIIHGHTHRPKIHHTRLNNETVTRIVLGDWYEHGSVLSIKTRSNTEDLDYNLEGLQ